MTATVIVAFRFLVETPACPMRATSVANIRLVPDIKDLQPLISHRTTAVLGPANGYADSMIAIIQAVAESFEDVTLVLPGLHASSIPLLTAGFLVEDVDTLMLGRPDMPDLERHVPEADLG